MTENTKQTEIQRLADLIGETSVLMTQLMVIDDERCERLRDKCIKRYARLMNKYIQLDPDMEALSGNKVIQGHLDDMYTCGSDLITQYGNLDKMNTLSPITRRNLVSISFIALGSVVATSKNYMDPFDETMVMTSAILAAYRLGLEDGMRGFALSLSAAKMGSD